MFNLAQQEIFERYKNPLFAGKIENPDLQASGSNQTCGDEVSFFIRLTRETISEIYHTTRACAICTASADLLAERLKGQSLASLQKIRGEEIVESLAIPLSPVRLECALLPLETLKQAQV